MPKADRLGAVARGDLGPQIGLGADFLEAVMVWEQVAVVRPTGGIDDASDAGVECCGATHWAWLCTGHQDAIGEINAAQRSSGHADGVDFRVGGWISITLTGIARLGDHFTGASHNGSEWSEAGITVESLAHCTEGFIKEKIVAGLISLDRTMVICADHR
jgi:hypothetical protein